jgi:WD40 repeat protein
LKTLNFNDSVKCVETFNDDKMLIIGTAKGDVIIYDLNKNEELNKINSAHSFYVWRLILLSNGNLLTSSENGEIKLWNLLES